MQQRSSLLSSVHTCAKKQGLRTAPQTPGGAASRRQAFHPTQPCSASPCEDKRDFSTLHYKQRGLPRSRLDLFAHDTRSQLHGTLIHSLFTANPAEARELIKLHSITEALHQYSPRLAAWRRSTMCSVGMSCPLPRRCRPVTVGHKCAISTWIRRYKILGHHSIATVLDLISAMPSPGIST